MKIPNSQDRKFRSISDPYTERMSLWPKSGIGILIVEIPIEIGNSEHGRSEIPIFHLQKFRSPKMEFPLSEIFAEFLPGKFHLGISQVGILPEAPLGPYGGRLWRLYRV
jgi:hypothetical protein